MENNVYVYPAKAQASDEKRSRRVAVIGAGPAGLTTMKELLEQGHDVFAFEAAPAIGGVYWSHYGALRLTSSSLTTPFSCHSDGKEAEPVIWNREEYLAYLGAFAERFKLYDHLRLGVGVTKVEQLPRGDVWRVHWRNCANAQDEGFVDVDSVAICSGVHSEPKIPHFPGLETFDGKVQHSSTYLSEENLGGERVLIIGLGESGSDIALLAARTAAAVALSTRKGPGYVVPRFFAGKPTDLDTNRCYHAIPRKYSNNPILRMKVKIENLYLGSQDDKKVLAKTSEINQRRGRSPFQRFGTKNTSFVEAMLNYGAEYKPDIASIAGRKVTFTDGSEFTADRIIFCTGYRARYPFLDECPRVAEGGANPRLMFKRMIHPDVGAAIAWIGLVRPGFGSIPPMAEMQARYFAQLVSGKLHLPPRDAMIDDINRHEQADIEQYPDDADAIKPLTDYLRFMDSMAAEIGCAPSLTRLFFTRPGLWFKVLFGPLAGVQFRLTGPGADPVGARAVLARMPTMPWPVLAYEFAFLSASKGVEFLRGVFNGQKANMNELRINHTKVIES